MASRVSLSTLLICDEQEPVLKEAMSCEWIPYSSRQQFAYFPQSFSQFPRMSLPLRRPPQSLEVAVATSGVAPCRTAHERSIAGPGLLHGRRLGGPVSQCLLVRSGEAADSLPVPEK